MTNDFDKDNFSEETFSGSDPNLNRTAQHEIHVKNYDVDMDRIKQQVKQPEPPAHSSEYGDDYNADADAFEGSAPAQPPVRAYSVPTETAAQRRRREQREEQKRRKTKSAILITVLVILMVLLVAGAGILIYNAVGNFAKNAAESTQSSAAPATDYAVIQDETSSPEPNADLNAQVDPVYDDGEDNSPVQSNPGDDIVFDSDSQITPDDDVIIDDDGADDAQDNGGSDENANDMPIVYE